MIKKVIPIFVFAIALIVFGQCKEKTKITQDKITKSEVKSAVMEQKQRNLVGGWKAIGVTSTIEDLATYVMTENNLESPIKELSNISSQIVSGKKYSFQILLENGEQWEAQVYVNIQKERSITALKQIKN
jgi:DNA-directed RNA polymerase